MSKAVITHDAEQIARARDVHMNGGTQAAVAIVLGCSQQTAGRRIKEWGWPRIRRLRPAAKIRFVGPSAGGAKARGAALAYMRMGDANEDVVTDAGAFAPFAAEDGDMAARMRTLVAREMARVELCGGAPDEIARTLASLARTLKLLSTLPDEAPVPAPAMEDFSEDAATMRENIARRLDELVAEEMAREALEAEATGFGDRI